MSGLDPRGSVVAVTGASAGIGWATALHFARAGARLAVCARRRERLVALEGELQALGAETLTQVVDVAQGAEVRAFVQATLARFGRLDVLVNNAGFGVRGPVETTPVEQVRRLMEVNYVGTLHGCLAALPVMRRQGRGVIVNVSSIVGHRALPGGGPYAATKAAQISLCEALRGELRGSGIDVCSVHPIGTETEFGEVAARASPGSSAQGVGPQQKADDVARAIVRCVRRPRPEVYPYRPARLLVLVNALWPSLLDWLLTRAATRAGRI